MMIAKAIKTCW